MRLLVALRVELSKLRAQRATYAGFGVVTALVGLFVWGTWREGSPLNARPLPEDFILVGKLVTGVLMPYVLLTIPVALLIFIPLLIATTVGGLFAAEGKAGTLRTLMTRPVSRGTVLSAKLLAAWAYAAALTVFMGVAALILGYAVFGRGDLLALELDAPGLNIIPEQQAWLRLAFAYGLATLGMMAVASLALFLSVVCDNPLTAAGLTVAFLLVCAVVKQIPYFEWLWPYLLTEHITIYSRAFAAALAWGDIGRSVAYLGGYILIPAGLAAAVFQRRDILC